MVEVSMKKIFKNKVKNSETNMKKIWMLCIVFVVLGMACSGPRDYVLVVDTSKSMVMGDNVMQKLKDNMKKFVKDIRYGDTVTLMSFDAKVKEHGIYEINTSVDRDRVLKKIVALPAKGIWTDMVEMLNKLSVQAEKLQAKDRQLMVVVMTDGLDDPSPLKKREAIRLDKIKKKGKWKQPYVYYVSLGKLHDKKLLENLESMSSNVKKIDGTGTAGLDEVREDINFKEMVFIGLGILGLALFVGGVIACIFWFLTRHHTKGTLSFYHVDVGPALRKSYTLDRLNRHSFHIGRQRGADLKIRDFGSKVNLTISAKLYNGVMCLKPNQKDLPKFKFDAQRFKNLIAPGDKFEVGNHKFEYRQ